MILLIFLKIVPTHYNTFDKIVLTNENDTVSNVYYVNKSTSYLIRVCPLLKFYRLSKNIEIIDLMVSLLDNKYPDEGLTCQTVKKNLCKMKSMIPIEKTCMTCQHYTHHTKKKANNYKQS